MSATILLVLRLSLTIVLYIFLGFVLYSLWLDIKKRTQKPDTASENPIELILKDGETRKFFHHFDGKVVTVGRDPINDLHLEDSTMSAQHARLSFHHEQWWVEDLRSTNGTYLNQVHVTEPVVVTDGDQLRCGKVVMMISMSGEQQVD
ncbi:MAG: FHA domain-containing protein [Chloroflexota bacterium]|nr:FHA domain-containing protein [Chloroflexota bacterium]